MATKKNSTKAIEQQRATIACDLMHEAISKIIAMRQLTVSCQQDTEISDGASNALVSLRTILGVCGHLMEKSIRTLDPNEPGIMGDADAWLLNEKLQDRIDGFTKSVKAQATA